MVKDIKFIDIPVPYDFHNHQYKDDNTAESNLWLIRIHQK